jgi:hypothetical protein
MMDFTLSQQKMIFNAVRYYQMNRVPFTSKAYQECDEILNTIFPVAKDLPPSKLSTDGDGQKGKAL